MKQVLIISNCAAESYHKTLSRFLPDFKVSSMHVSRLQAGPTENDVVLESIGTPDYILTLPSQTKNLAAKFSDKTKLIEIPGFYFSGYHPDTCYVVERQKPGRQVGTDFGAYHSIIAFGAFLSGLNVQDTLTLYRGDIYERLGYFDDWEASKSAVLNDFRAASLPIDAQFKKWSRGGCFMHTINHPHVQCFTDIARQVCKLHFPEFVDVPYPIPDGLSHASIYPSYPEIAERYGSWGSHIFKINGQDRVVDLEQYVKMCFSAYEGYEDGAITVAGPYSKKLAKIQDYINSEFGK